MNGKIHVVTSVMPGNGSKYVATNLAFEFQRKFKNQKILLIDFDFENPYLAYEYVKHDEVHGIDNIINSISGEGLSAELFKENIIHTSINIDILRGTKFSDQYKLFTKEIIETILDLSKSLYDHIFIVVNSKANNAGTVYSILEADNLIVMAKNDYTNMLRIKKTLKILLQYYKSTKKIILVYNFKNHNTKADVNSKIVGLNVLVGGVLEYAEKTIDNLNLEKRMKMFGIKCVNNKAYLKIIDLLLQS